MSNLRFGRTIVDGVEIFHREAGPADAPAILLLHGFPSSSFMFRDLIPALAGTWRVIAPDLPGFGFSAAPDRGSFHYSFAHYAELIGKFVDAIGLDRFALYVFDYGAPVGFRLAAARPQQITALISQNGNAYVEGLSDGWNPMRAYWADPSDANRQALRAMLDPGTTLFQYTHGAADPRQIAPEGYTLDNALLARPGIDDIQLDLFGDYRANIDMYPAFQAYFRDRQPPFLAVWGRNDPFFLAAGADAFRRDLPDADIRFFDTGHFALETHAAEIAAVIDAFLARHVGAAAPVSGFALFADLSPSTAPQAAQPVLDAMAGMFEFTPNLAVKMAADPAALGAYAACLQAYGTTMALSPIEQQIVLIASSRANDAAYSVAVHTTLARRLGAGPDIVQAAASGATLPDARLAALARFTTELTRRRGHVPDAEIGRFIAAGFDRAAIVAVAMGVSLKSFANSVALIAAPAIDAGFAS